MENPQRHIKINFEYGGMKNPVHSEKLVYHYCSTRAFFEIIRSGKIRLGNLLLMNDPTELFLRKFPIAKHVYELYKNYPFEFKIQEAEKEFGMNDYLIPARLESNLFCNRQYSKLFFAFCLTTESDSLSQWRQYGENGKGICLGFDVNLLKKYAENNADFNFQQVEYSKDYQDSVHVLAKHILKKIKELYSNGKIDELLAYRYNLVEEQIDEWSRYKIIDYKYENEVRLTYVLKSKSVFPNANPIDLKEFCDRDDIEFDIGREQIKVYKTVSLKDLGLQTITLGPQNNHDKQIINILLAKYGIDIKNSSIYKSCIPYRG